METVAGLKIDDESARCGGTKIDKEKLAHFPALVAGYANHTLAKARLVTGVDDDKVGDRRAGDLRDASGTHRAADRNRPPDRGRARKGDGKGEKAENERGHRR